MHTNLKNGMLKSTKYSDCLLHKLQGNVLYSVKFLESRLKIISYSLVLPNDFAILVTCAFSINKARVVYCIVLRLINYLNFMYGIVHTQCHTCLHWQICS